MPLGLLCLALALLGAMLPVSHADGPPQPRPKKAAAPNYQTLELGAARYRFPVYANHNLAHDDMRSIEHVLVLVHGVERNADHYFKLGETLLAASPARTNHTLVLAPKFVALTDLPGFDGMVVWRHGGWSDGEESVQPVPVSSFQVNIFFAVR